MNNEHGIIPFNHQMERGFFFVNENITFDVINQVLVCLIDGYGVFYTDYLPDWHRAGIRNLGMKIQHLKLFVDVASDMQSVTALRGRMIEVNDRFIPPQPDIFQQMINDGRLENDYIPDMNRGVAMKIFD